MPQPQRKPSKFIVQLDNMYTEFVEHGIVILSLKRVCHEIFDLHLFHDSTPFGPLIFEFCFDFAEIFDHKVISAGCCTPLRSSLWRVHCTEIISAVCCTLWRWSPRYVAHRVDDLCSILAILHTSKIISAVGCTLRRSLCDRISRRNRNLIQKYFKLLIRGPDGFESWKK